MRLQIYHYETGVEVLGKGKRFALWVQGCNKRCFNCLVPDSWDLNGGESVRVEELARKVKNVDGVTISGGEPFLQSLALARFLDLLDDRLDVIVYSGFKYDEIVKDEQKRELLDRIDLLIDGEYVDSLNVDEPMIGSSNQNIYILSDKGKELAEYMQSLSGREVEFRVKDGELFTVGVVPKKMKGFV